MRNRVIVVRKTVNRQVVSVIKSLSGTQMAQMFDSFDTRIVSWYQFVRKFKSSLIEGFGSVFETTSGPTLPTLKPAKKLVVWICNRASENYNMMCNHVKNKQKQTRDANEIWIAKSYSRLMPQSFRILHVFSLRQCLHEGF